MKHHSRGTVVIVGASIAGLLAAAAVAGRYQRVILLDRDALPDTPVLRKGAPQGAHVHGLLEHGQRALEKLLPGIIDEVIAAGGGLGDLLAEGLFYIGTQRLAQGESGLFGLVVSRPLLEWMIRRRVEALPNVEIRSSVEVTELLYDIARRRVTGVMWRGVGSAIAPAALEADLVIDAAGRGSRCLRWLQQLGYATPLEQRQQVDVTYTSCYFQRSATDLPGLRAVLCAPSAERPTPSGLLEQEGNRWVVSVGGFDNQAAPTDLEGFRAYLQQHAPAEIAQVAMASTPIGHPLQFRYPASVRRRFERLARFPGGYLVLGDALCCFNPVYGQGMTVAAHEALTLRRCLDLSPAQLARRFFKLAAKLIDQPWEITVSSDLALPMVKGERPFGFGLVNGYMNRLVSAARSDLTLAHALLSVIHLRAPSSSLMHPALLWRVMRAGR